MAIVMVASLIASFGCVNASADTAYAVLDHAETLVYGSTITRDIYVKTDASTANQQVYVHYDKAAGQAWADEQADYYKTLSDGSKIWKATITSSEDNTEFVIKYVANGTTIWDNNNGQNYSGNNTLGCAPVVAVRPVHYSYYFTSFISAKLQNYGYQKNVFVRYTCNGWKTYTDVELTYSSTNADGTENWSGSVTRTYDCSDFQYCIGYEVNGQTYWANNFGDNYDWYFIARD